MLANLSLSYIFATFGPSHLRYIFSLNSLNVLRLHNTILPHLTVFRVQAQSLNIVFFSDRTGQTITSPAGKGRHLPMRWATIIESSSDMPTRSSQLYRTGWLPYWQYFSICHQFAEKPSWPKVPIQSSGTLLEPWEQHHGLGQSTQGLLRRKILGCLPYDALEIIGLKHVCSHGFESASNSAKPTNLLTTSPEMAYRLIDGDNWFSWEQDEELPKPSNANQNIYENSITPVPRTISQFLAGVMTIQFESAFHQAVRSV